MYPDRYFLHTKWSINKSVNLHTFLTSHGKASDKCMNRIEGIIENIDTRGSLSLVNVRSQDVKLTAIVIDTPETADYLGIGNKIHVLFKETEVIVGKGSLHRVSLQNKIPGRVEKIESGDLLSRLSIHTPIGLITSVITNRAVLQLDISVDSEVTAMVKTNEVMLSA